jgi:hypothetical protein
MKIYHMVNFNTLERFDGSLKAIWRILRQILRTAERNAGVATIDIYNPEGRLLGVFYRGFMEKNLIYRRG